MLVSQNLHELAASYSTWKWFSKDQICLNFIIVNLKRSLCFKYLLQLSWYHFETNFSFLQVSIEPESDKDYLGHTFKDLQSFVSDKMNKSFKDVEQTKSKLDKSDYENQSLRERLKEAEAKLNKRDEKVKRDRAKVQYDVKNYTSRPFEVKTEFISD